MTPGQEDYLERPLRRDSPTNAVRNATRRCFSTFIVVLVITIAILYILCQCKLFHIYFLQHMTRLLHSNELRPVLSQHIL